MNWSARISFTHRLAIFLAFWFVAALVCVAFGEFTVEAGENKTLEDCQLVLLMPVMSAIGTLFTFVTLTGGNPRAQNSFANVDIVVLLIGFIVHGVVALTRKNRRQFFVCCLVQAVFLAVCTGCLLYFFHYDATHGHG